VFQETHEIANDITEETTEAPYAFSLRGSDLFSCLQSGEREQNYFDFQIGSACDSVDVLNQRVIVIFCCV
jgi:hypothetical protein